MTPEERGEAIQILAERYMSRVYYGDRVKSLEYIKHQYNSYSDEYLLKLILNPLDN